MNSAPGAKMMAKQKETEVQKSSSSVPSQTVSKPRSFEQLAVLQSSVKKYYAQRLRARLNEQQELNASAVLGDLRPPDMNDYQELLDDYCADMLDLYNAL